MSASRLIAVRMPRRQYGVVEVWTVPAATVTPAARGAHRGAVGSENAAIVTACKSADLPPPSSKAGDEEEGRRNSIGGLQTEGCCLSISAASQNSNNRTRTYTNADSGGCTEQK